MKSLHTTHLTASLKARAVVRTSAIGAGVLSVMLAALAQPAWSQAGGNQEQQLVLECANRKAQLGLAGNPSTQVEREKAMRFENGCQKLIQNYKLIITSCLKTTDPVACQNKPEMKTMADMVFNQTVASIRNLGI